MNAARGNKSRTGVAALVGGLLVANVALADARALNSETVSRTIDVSGLDLSSPAGAERAYRHIAAAAKKICLGTSNSIKGVARARLEHESARCFDEAVANALAEIAARTGIDLEQVAASDGSASPNFVARR